MIKKTIVAAVIILTGFGLIIYSSACIIRNSFNIPFSFILIKTAGFIVFMIGLLILLPVYKKTFKTSRGKFSEEVKGIYDPNEKRSSSSRKILSLIAISFIAWIGLLIIITIALIILIFYYINHVFKNWQLF